MSLNIQKGKIARAVRAVLYGVEGIGKTTLAMKIPGALNLDVEDGSGELDIARSVATDWRACEHAIKELIADQQGFRAVVIDTADWLEKALIEFMLKSAGKKSIEDYGYGKGFTMLQEHFGRFLALTDQLVAKGVHVVFVAHSKVVRTSPPDQTDGFDRYELKLTKQVAPLLKEWADMILFCNYKIQIVEGTDGRLKAQGGKERVMYATRSAAWDAKNRYGLPDEMPMQFEHIAHIFAGAQARSVTTTETPPPENTQRDAFQKAHGEIGSNVPTLATKEQLAFLNSHKEIDFIAALIEAALEPVNAVGIDELTQGQAEELIEKITAAQNEAANRAKATDKVSNPAKAPPHITTWLDANAQAVNAYMLRVKWIQPGQMWRQLDDEKMHMVIDKADKFARAAGIPAIGERRAA